MGMFDTLTCDYPLPDPRHQDLEFQTKDLEKVLGHYTITKDGRLIRHAQPSPFVPAPVSDVEWPIHGDIRIYERDPDAGHGLIEYAVRFTYGRVDWIRRVRLEGGAPSQPPPKVGRRPHQLAGKPGSGPSRISRRPHPDARCQGRPPRPMTRATISVTIDSSRAPG